MRKSQNLRKKPSKLKTPERNLSDEDRKRIGEMMTKVRAKKGEIKRERLNKVLNKIIELRKATNNQIENFMGISDATTTRYLDQLEKEGKIRQVGKTGKYTYYKPI